MQAHSDFIKRDFIKQQLEVICFSYQYFAGEILTPNEIQNAVFALVSHGTEQDPIFNYGNKTALGLFEMSWEEFTKLPSRLSAREQQQSERARLLSEVTEQGYSKNYRGIRVSKTGRLFQIEDTIVCNLLDPRNMHHGNMQRVGQSALIRKWRYL